MAADPFPSADPAVSVVAEAWLVLGQQTITKPNEFSVWLFSPRPVFFGIAKLRVATARSRRESQRVTEPTFGGGRKGEKSAKDCE